MAELILTDKEKAQSYADADELALGKLCKKVAFQLGLGDCVDSFMPAAVTVATQAFIFAALQANAAEIKITTDYDGGKAEGSWEFICKRVDKRKEKELDSRLRGNDREGGSDADR